jgi:CHAT domain-containing protein/tetratricopeptide (TPR) repeat protein
MIVRHGRRVVTALALLAFASSAHAQPYASFAAPDSALPAALRAVRNDYETIWNALFVSELRAKLAKADSAARLFQMEQRVAKAEPEALNSRIGEDALKLRAKWKPAQQRLRVEASVKESLATVARQARQWAPAESLYRASLADYRTLVEKRREATVLGTIGAMLLTSRQTDRALEVYGEALTARRALADPRLLGNTLGDLGQTYLTLQRYDEAIVNLREAAEIREKAGLMGPLGRTLNFLGIALERAGRPDTAEVCFRRGIAVSSADGDSASTYTALNGYGSFLANAGRTEEATAVYERAMATARSTKDARRILQAERSLAEAERSVGRLTDAAHRFESALVLAAGDQAAEADIRSKLGFVLYQIGDVERASAVTRRGLQIADSLQLQRERSRCYGALSAIGAESGDLNGALDLSSRALLAATAAGDSELVQRMAIEYGNVARAARRFDLAESLFARAAATTTAPTAELRSAMLGNHALVLHQKGQLDEAERGYQEALAIAEPSGLVEFQSRLLTNLGDVAERRGEWNEAFANYGRALALIDSVRELQTGERDRVKLQAARRFVYEAVIHLMTKRHLALPDSGYGDRAFVLAERARARSLLDLVAASRSMPSPEPLTPDGAAKLLPKTTVLLEYSTGDSSTTLWVVRRDRRQVFQLPSRSALRSRIQSLRRALADPAGAEAGDALTASRALYRALVAPAEPLLKGAKEIVISPDGALATLPFEALLASDAKQGAVPKGGWLAEKYTVSYAPSATAMSLARPRAGGEALLAVSNPRFPTGTVAGVAPLDSLPGTAGEVAALTRIWGTKPMRDLSQTAATRRHVLVADELKSARLVHIATHGDVNAAEPERSGLWLAPENAGDPPSRIEVRDVTPLTMSADLVTLSACESGLGRIETGEGVIGLARGFLVAGSRSVVVSLWKVNDASTAVLMEGFYREWLSKGRDRATALTLAKRELLKNPATRSPFHWAPFVLIGDPAL